MTNTLQIKPEGREYKYFELFSNRTYSSKEEIIKQVENWTTSIGSKVGLTFIEEQTKLSWSNEHRHTLLTFKKGKWLYWFTIRDISVDKFKKVLLE